MSKLPKVSIIIPTKDRSAYLRKSIEAALSQKFKNYEVIVSNNNSKDNTKEELNKLSSEFQNLKVINHGIDYPLNKHWDKVINEVATGDYIMVIPDDDCIIDFDYIQDCVEIFLKDKSIGIVFSNYNIVNSQGELISKVKVSFSQKIEGQYLLGLYKRKLQGVKGVGIPHLTAVFSKNAYKTAGGFNVDCLSPDTHLWLKILLHYNAGFIERFTANYLVHDLNLSNTKNLTLIRKDLKIIPNVFLHIFKTRKKISFNVVINLIRIHLYFIWVYVKRLQSLLKKICR